MKIKAVLIQFIIIIIHLGDYIERPHTIFHSFKLHFLFLHFITYIHNVHNVHNVHSVHLYINLACLSVCLFVCLFVSNKRQNGWTDRAQIFCGTSRDHREGLWMIKISNICLHQNSIFIKFLKILKTLGEKDSNFEEGFLKECQPIWSSRWSSYS